jgi:hypothetical protein
MRREASPLFLERRSYRLRRLMDGARLMPFLGGGLWAVPMLWGGAAGTGGISTSQAMLYIFGVWLALTLLAAILSLFLNARTEKDSQPPSNVAQSGLSASTAIPDTPDTARRGAE